VDQLRYTFTNDAYAVNATTPTVARTRTAIVAKSAMNEDPQQGAMGQELTDEIYGKITVTYAASKPIGASEPTPATTSVITAAWKPTGLVIGPKLEGVEVPAPEAGGEVLVRVVLSGICNTDLELARGYAGFRGTIGHEFVGISCGRASRRGLPARTARPGHGHRRIAGGAQVRRGGGNEAPPFRGAGRE